MATKKPALKTKSLLPDDGVSVPRIRLSEVGVSALKTRQGKIYEEANVTFRYPNMLRVVAEMKYSPPVAIALGAINTLMNRAEVTVTPIVNETAVDRKRREFLLSVLHDMDDSWQATMQSISTYKEYGHQVSEMVFRRRLKNTGSKFNDGLVGLSGLRNRPQNSIARWNFSDDGRTLVGISQSIVNMERNERFKPLLNSSGFIDIPREKFILFRCDPTDDNPEGTSILRPAYLAYKQLSLITDQMLTGIAKDITGVPLAKMPPEYMDPEASPAQKATYLNMQSIVANASSGQSAGVIIPTMIDPESKIDMFSFELLENKSGKSFDLESIIKMLQANILSVMGCDSITMGDKGGSLSLQDGDTNMLAMGVSYRLSEIANTLNKELVPILWELNKWDTSRMPNISFKDVSSVSLEEFSKFLQRVMSVGGLEMDRGVMNKIREIGGFDILPEDAPLDKENLSTTLAGKASSAGQGMAPGTSGNGTSVIGGKGSKTDASTTNLDNQG